METISANYDPSVSGLPGNVGEIVLVAGGASAWEKFGVAVTDWRPYPTPAASALVSGLLAVADFNKLATIPSAAFSANSVAGFVMVSPEIDFAATGTTVLIPPMAKALGAPGTSIWITAKDGTVTTGPFLSYGCNTNVDDFVANAVIAAFATQAVGTRIGAAGTTVNPVPFLDMTTNGFRLKVNTAAVLGTATVLRGRYVNLMAPTPIWYP